MLLLSFPFCKDQGEMPGTASVTLAAGGRAQPLPDVFLELSWGSAQQDHP